jgi:hypothetical protein
MPLEKYKTLTVIEHSTKEIIMEEEMIDIVDRYIFAQMRPCHGNRWDQQSVKLRENKVTVRWQEER